MRRYQHAILAHVQLVARRLDMKLQIEVVLSYREVTRQWPLRPQLLSPLDNRRGGFVAILNRRIVLCSFYISIYLEEVERTFVNTLTM